MLEVDKKTGWLWILSFIGIAAFPPSMLFVSEFMIVKSLFAQHKIGVCLVFLLLLTIILYGLAKATIKMAYLPVSEEKRESLNVALKTLDIRMYLPQIVMLSLAFILGILMPEPLVDLINKTVIGF